MNHKRQYHGSKLKLIPKGVSKKVKKKASINVDRIHKIEKKVNHDVIAFLTSITEKVGPEGRFLHKGMTSSDVLDTCFNIQLLQSGKIILKDIDELLNILKGKSLKYKKNYLYRKKSWYSCRTNYVWFKISKLL